MQFGNIVTILVFAGAGAKAWYQPTAGTTWDWQLQVLINPTAAVQVYDIDMFDNTAAVVTDLHNRGKKVICYIDVGSWENYRSDASKFPASLLGLKNDINQVKDLVGNFDFAVSEQSFQYGEYSFLVPFIQANKPVFEAEYSWKLTQFCLQAIKLNFSSIRKKNALDSYREACR
ncbi:glycoside-hydrolase family GH114-domain-containing protein [Leptodontidium sp. 2 PMI_412]|nr:glycoside-hydrolase family GH114-domain-containing protein [Leptodontidium sp. 2 PMI_412]